MIKSFIMYYLINMKIKYQTKVFVTLDGWRLYAKL